MQVLGGYGVNVYKWDWGCPQGKVLINQWI